MEELSLREVQKIELELLLKFDSICQKNHMRYSLGGGSLLGAIRHKGFMKGFFNIARKMKSVSICSHITRLRVIMDYLQKSGTRKP